MFKMPSRSSLEKTATKLLQELFGHEVEEEEEEIEISEQENLASPNTFSQHLENIIAKETAPAVAEKGVTKKSLQTEMALFEATNQRGDNLEKLFLVLKNISPTSIASEQAFSIAGNFVTKIRSRLSDESIDDLCFEKGYFAKERHF